MKVEVAIGEIFDKITILDIKLERISDESRLSYVQGEKDVLEEALKLEGVEIDSELYQELRDINMKIWDTEAGFREKEAEQEFDDEFVQFARLNAKYNDERFLIKKRINEHYDSPVREQKSYDRLYNAN
tara:strand:- start:2865 stop:3251 length:387 start_codon:yes stop_codon:yes gene_type:complete